MACGQWGLYPNPAAEGRRLCAKAPGPPAGTGGRPRDDGGGPSVRSAAWRNSAAGGGIVFGRFPRSGEIQLPDRSPSPGLP